MNNHQVAVIIADLLDDDCACNINNNDEWLPKYCEFANTCCPNPVGVACWEQYLKHLDKRRSAAMTNAELFKKTFHIYATEMWSKPEQEFLDWLNAEVEAGETEERSADDGVQES